MNAEPGTVTRQLNANNSIFTRSMLEMAVEEHWRPGHTFDPAGFLLVAASDIAPDIQAECYCGAPGAPQLEISTEHPHGTLDVWHRAGEHAIFIKVAVISRIRSRASLHHVARTTEKQLRTKVEKLRGELTAAAHGLVLESVLVATEKPEMTLGLVRKALAKMQGAMDAYEAIQLRHANAEMLLAEMQVPPLA